MRVKALHAGKNTSGQAESDGGLRLPDVERVVAEQISPYSVSRLINSIGFRLGMPREHEVARRYLPVIRAGREADVCLAVGGEDHTTSARPAPRRASPAS